MYGILMYYIDDVQWLINLNSDIGIHNKSSKGKLIYLRTFIGKHRWWGQVF